MKTKWLAALAACVLTLFAAGCDDGFTEAALNAIKNNAAQKTVPAESIALNMRTLTLKTGRSATLVAAVLPEDTTDKVKWSSSDEEVAMVDRDGTVTAVTEGSAVITAKAGSLTATCTVTVKDILVPVQSVRLSNTSLRLTRGETERLTATVWPSNADITAVTWQSSDPEVAEVDENGTVTAKAAGSATITAATQEGGKTATCRVTVNPKPVERVTLSEETLTLRVGTTERLTAAWEPEDADVTSVTWESSDKAVATVGEDGTVTAKKKGDATITVTIRWGYWNSMTATCAVTVTLPDVGDDFQLDDYGYLTGYTGSGTDVVIPGGVRGIGYGAFKGNTDITGVTIPGSVTSIGYYAFEGCTSLERVEIPGSVTDIGSSAFEGCTSLASVTIPDNVTKIAWSAFWECTGLESVDIGDGVTEIGIWAFYGYKSLKSVTIGKGVTSIGDWAFSGCSSLKSVTIPDGVTSIGYYAFEDCTSLASVTIGDGVTSIEPRAFEGCTSLTSVKIPDSVTSIESRTFYECTSLASVDIGDGVTEIGSWAFRTCKSLTSVKIPDSVTSIGSGAFYECPSLEDVYYDGTLAQWCGISWGDGPANPLYNENAVLYIGGSAVTGAVDIPEGVTEIKASAFYDYRSLTKVTLPSTVTSIGGYAFRGCTGLEGVTIGDGVMSIGDYAFYGCSELTSVTYEGTKEEWGEIERGSGIFSKVTEITDKDGVTFTVDKDGNITAE